MSLKLLRVIWSDRRGTALIEGAIMLPVLFVLFFGVFEFSWYFYEQHRVSTGIRDAARYIARSDNLIWKSINTAPTIPDAVKCNAQLLAVTGDTSGSCPSTGSRVAGWTTDYVTINVRSTPCTAPNNCQGGATTMFVVNVSSVNGSTTPFAPASLGFLGFLKLGPFGINVTHDERLTMNGT
jgi:Flp pilus assembly protein TadG